ncbi:S41 family peptidase [Paramaledivibacter caminithermalis]|uniref:C-terminal processing peptidase-3. Serine peptidase. MEROPS family S41A n=1 Tax=Paramaledivibacter caminithermalis (strain DSM 15212 / CIP 107654 / DViRD3) TaxID=1121301 RepID=A0A1M6KU86_PARC5|nr:S41 family peptidase [Paramaledivibacter caminithermalis]SHJ62420.1 C-terminal processing peptidase-3. Serine peptidase. MEROPS family S41A [Paramaledivibacter caminithermalis DSM 15212]
MIKKRTAFIGAIVLIIVTSLFTTVISNMVAIQFNERVYISKNEYERLVAINEKFNKVLYLKKYIEDNYYQPVDEKVFEDGILKGLFEALGDPYSEYMTKSEFDSFMTHTHGTYGGIGIIVTPGEDGYITVVSPIEDTPGERAGIISGDKIIKVNDKEVTGDKLDEAVAIMKGKPGTKVDITILRPNKKEPLTFTIEREEIRLKTVKSRVIDNDIGYLRITMFDDKTSEDFKKHLKDLESKNIKGLIIDLRNNPGGSLKECVEIADELLGKQTIVYTKDRAGNKEYMKSDAKKVDYPFAILVNKGSASASEILTGAVKDTKAGVIIGTTTFGKGLVQAVRELTDGTGFKLTISQYYTPNGEYIHGKGIEPNIVVELPEELKGKVEMTDEEDLQLQKAIEVLRGKI